jgi:hypothetical protein
MTISFPQISCQPSHHHFELEHKCGKDSRGRSSCDCGIRNNTTCKGYGKTTLHNENYVGRNLSAELPVFMMKHSYMKRQWNPRSIKHKGGKNPTCLSRTCCIPVFCHVPLAIPSFSFLARLGALLIMLSFVTIPNPLR